MINITVDGVVYPVPSSAADLDWAAKQFAFEQALAVAVNEALATPTWLVLARLNGWVNIAAAAPLGYYVDPFSMVHLRFALDTGVNNTVAFQLPAAARPPYPMFLTAKGGGDPANEVRVFINSVTGDVTLTGASGYDAGSGTYFEGTFSKVAGP